MSNYGLAILSHNNYNRFESCLDSIPKQDSNTPILVINDGEPYIYKKDFINSIQIIQHNKNKKIAKSKNEAIKYLLTFKNVEWIFIIEDDMKIINNNVFKRYIEVAEKFGLLHLNYALHGYDNFINGIPRPRVKYDGLSLYKFAGGCFQLFHRSIFESVGYFDENYINCWEHLDFTFRITLKGYHTPYWLAADINDSHLYIEQIEKGVNTGVSTSINNPNYYNGLIYWKNKFNLWVSEIPDWINPEYHTDKVINMIAEKRYNELSDIYKKYYKISNI